MKPEWASNCVFDFCPEESMLRNAAYPQHFASPLGSGVSVGAIGGKKAALYTGAQASGAHSWGNYQKTVGATAILVQLEFVAASVAACDMFSKWYSTYTHWNFEAHLSASGQVGLSLRHNDAVEQQFTATGSYSAGVRCNYVGHWRGGTYPDVCAINGKLEAASSWTKIGGLQSSAAPWELGVGGLIGTPFAGGIIAARVWINRRFSDGEVARLSESSSIVYVPQPQWLYTGMGSGEWTPLEVTG